MTNEEFIKQARMKYQEEGRIEIDDNAIVSPSADNGAYVQAWVRVYDKSQERYKE